MIPPGGWDSGRHPPLATLLGSCVAVCLHDPVALVGGMNHFLLPSHRGRHDGNKGLSGERAMELLLSDLIAHGARKDRLEAKAFGGANIVKTIRMDIGDRNAEFARTWLKDNDIPLVAEDMGGLFSRKVLFLPGHGIAYCRRLTISDSLTQEVVAEEISFVRDI